MSIQSSPPSITAFTGEMASAAKTGLRIVVQAIVIIVIMGPYAGAPHTRTEMWVFLALYFLLWSVLFIIFFRWQVRRILTGSNPQTQMIEALAVTFVLFMAIFAKCYELLSSSDPATFSQPLDYFTSYYFSLTVLATVGFGDIAPLTIATRAVTMLQMVLDLVLIGVAVRILTGASARALEKSREPATGNV